MLLAIKTENQRQHRKIIRNWRISDVRQHFFMIRIAQNRGFQIRRKFTAISPPPPPNSPPDSPQFHRSNSPPKNEYYKRFIIKHRNFTAPNSPQFHRNFTTPDSPQFHRPPRPCRPCVFQDFDVRAPCSSFFLWSLDGSLNISILHIDKDDCH